MYPLLRPRRDRSPTRRNSNSVVRVDLAVEALAVRVQGAKPGDLPVKQPTKVELFVSLKKAKSLGLKTSQSRFFEQTRQLSHGPVLAGLDERQLTSRANGW